MSLCVCVRMRYNNAYPFPLFKCLCVFKWIKQKVRTQKKGYIVRCNVTWVWEKAQRTWTPKRKKEEEWKQHYFIFNKKIVFPKKGFHSSHAFWMKNTFYSISDDDDDDATTTTTFVCIVPAPVSDCQTTLSMLLWLMLCYFFVLLTLLSFGCSTYTHAHTFRLQNIQYWRSCHSGSCQHLWLRKYLLFIGHVHGVLSTRDSTVFNHKSIKSIKSVGEFWLSHHRYIVDI